MRSRYLIHLPACTVAIAVAALVFHGPILQLARYHEFADQSLFLGVPHAADVLSNAIFAMAGLWGLCTLWPARRHPAIADAWPGYLLFLAALLLTSFGSAYYHLAPDNARLLWDRLPIALACAGLLAAVRAENVPGANALQDAFTLAAFAILSVAWWNISDRQGAGDLRPYLLLQALPLVLVPLWQHIYQAPVPDRYAFGAALLLYIAAKAAELRDHQLFALLQPVSGHTIKHLLAGLAAAIIVARLAKRVGRGKPAWPALAASL